MPASFKARAGKFLADCKVTIQTFIKNTVGGQVLRTQRKIVHGEFFGRVEGSGELFVPCDQELLVGLSPRQAALPRRLLQRRLAIHTALLHDCLDVSSKRHRISRIGGI